MFIEAIKRVTENYKATRWHHVLPILAALVFALTIYPTQADAQIFDDLEAKVPFEFHVDNTTLPAGEYRIHLLDDTDPSVMEITSADGSTSAVFQVQNTDANPAQDHTELVFNKYGKRYFLATLFEQGSPNGSQVVESRYEKTLSQETRDSQEHVRAHRRGQQGK